MKLRNLVADTAALEPGSPNPDIGGIAADSRAVRPGDAFVAVPGVKTDGLTFVPQALAAGAAAIIAERPPATALPANVAFVKVADARRTLALCAARIFPRQPRVIAAVTGTSGKTSTVSFARQIWSALGRSAASIGTIGVVSPAQEVYGALTTPDPIALHRTIDTLAGDGVTYLALEASSHGLDQHRLDGVRVGIAGFTNLSRDHLDYHPDLESYLAAKMRLFTELVDADGHAVIVTGHPHADAVVAAAEKRGLTLLTVGRAADCGIQIVDVAVDGFSQTLRLSYLGHSFRIRLPLVGAFQVENALVAAGFALASGEAPDAVFGALEGLHGAKGRLEMVGQHHGAPIFVDYAHKPDALAKALEALRPYAPGRLIVVFGAGGDRDSGKRPLMGEIAARLADEVIITDDNPRSEDPGAIRRAIHAAAPGAREIGDRHAAIRTAIAELNPGDTLLIAGKGHETGQIIGDQVLPFSDHEAVKAALEEIAA